MRKVRNITVSVTPEIYNQTRDLAFEYDTTVTAMLVFLLKKLPYRLRNARAKNAAAQPSQPIESVQSPAPPTPL
jgi:hypothetical protein